MEPIPHDRKLLVSHPWLFNYLFPFVSIAIIVLNIHQLQGKIPVTFDISGNAVQWEYRSWWWFAIMPGTQIIIAAIVFMLEYRWKKMMEHDNTIHHAYLRLLRYTVGYTGILLQLGILFYIGGIIRICAQPGEHMGIIWLLVILSGLCITLINFIIRSNRLHQLNI